MNDHGDKQTAFEMCVVVPRRIVKKEDKKYDCIEVLIKELKNVGFIIDRAVGLTDEFIKVFFFFIILHWSPLFFSKSSILFRTILRFHKFAISICTAFNYIFLMPIVSLLLMAFFFFINRNERIIHAFLFLLSFLVWVFFFPGVWVVG